MSNNYTTIILPEAKVDLDEAFAYLEGEKPTLGFDLLAEFADILTILESNPYLYQKIDGEVRRAVTRKFRYNVFFVIKGEEVFINAILHGGRDSDKWMNRRR